MWTSDGDHTTKYVKQHEWMWFDGKYKRLREVMPAGGSGARTPSVLEATVKELPFVLGVTASPWRGVGMEGTQNRHAI